MAIQAKKAVKYQIKVKIALMGPSGSGKTFSALRLAGGFGPKTLLGNTEADRGYLYAGKFNYDIADLSAPYTPEKYIELIEYAEKEGYDTLIIDSGTHEWSGRGGLLEVHGNMPGNSYTNWAKITPRHNSFVDKILYSKVNIIVCLRGKDVYVMAENEKGKQAPKKEGLGADMRANFEYEMMATLMIDQQSHVAMAMKDNTGLFENRYEMLTEEHGRLLIQWANDGIAAEQPNWMQMQYQYQPQQQFVQPEFAPAFTPAPQEQLPFTPAPFNPAPVDPVPVQSVPTQPVIGFPYLENEIVGVWMNAGWPADGIPGWVVASSKFGGRSPSQLTYEECKFIYEEFFNYANQKTGGNQ